MRLSAACESISIRPSAAAGRPGPSRVRGSCQRSSPGPRGGNLCRCGAPRLLTRQAPRCETAGGATAPPRLREFSVFRGGLAAGALGGGVDLLAREAPLPRCLGRARRQGRPGVSLPRLERAPDPLQGDLSIAELRAVVARDAHDAGGPVRHAHGRLRLVPVLSPGTRAAERLDVAVLQELFQLCGQWHGASVRHSLRNSTGCGAAEAVDRFTRCTSPRSPCSPRSASCSRRTGDRKSTRLNSSHGYISYAAL